jgi:hypothetical protein
MMISDEQRARLLAAINRQAAKPPAPRLADSDIEAIRSLVESGREDAAWRELNEKWAAALTHAQALITRQSAEIASAIELQKMARRTQGAMNTLFQAQTKAAATPGEQPFRPRVGWQIALFDAWPDICKALGHAPAAAEAVTWLRQNDTSGCIVHTGTRGGLCWQPPEGDTKEVDLKTVENVLSAWRNADLLPS